MTPLPESHKHRRLRSLMKERLPGYLLSLLQGVGETADRQRVSVYVVGGIVRDLLLDAPNPEGRSGTRFEVDLIVESDGIRFCESPCPNETRLALPSMNDSARLPSRSRTDTPSTWPRLEPNHTTLRLCFRPCDRGSLREDLCRRDFTINALAIRLNASRFGEVVDCHDGRRDLQDKTIRVLHGLSFIDDPTRVFRAIRYEQRLGFQLDRNTAVLMTEAVKMGLVHRLSPSRLSAELLHVLSEREPVNILARLADFNLLQFIHPRLKWSPASLDS